MNGVKQSDSILKGAVAGVFFPIDGVVRRGSMVAGWIAGFGVISLFVLIFINVFLRYIFQAPFIHTDELIRYLNAWVAYFSLAYTLRTGGHIAIEAVTKMMPYPIRRRVESVGALLTAGWVILITYGGWKFWFEMVEIRQRSEGPLEIQMWIPGLCIVPGLTWFALEIVLSAVKRWFPLRSKAFESDIGSKGE